MASNSSVVFSTTPILGVDLDAKSSTPVFGVNTAVFANDGRKHV